MALINIIVVGHALSVTYEVTYEAFISFKFN
jgi:hypothetical protein